MGSQSAAVTWRMPIWTSGYQADRACGEEITTSRRTFRGCWIAVRIAQAAPNEWPTTSARGIPRWSISAATSSPSVSNFIGRSVSAVRPWPCISTATTCRDVASTSSHPRISPMVVSPPWISTMGSPEPWTS